MAGLVTECKTFVVRCNALPRAPRRGRQSAVWREARRGLSQGGSEPPALLSKWLANYWGAYAGCASMPQVAQRPRTCEGWMTPPFAISDSG